MKKIIAVLTEIALLYGVFYVLHIILEMREWWALPTSILISFCFASVGIYIWMITE